MFSSSLTRPKAASSTSPPHLTGDSGQKPNRVGNYELAIALREPADWAPDLISKLGLYSLQAVLEPTATMDVTGAFPKGSTLNSLVFLEYTTEQTRFQLDGREKKRGRS